MDNLESILSKLHSALISASEFSLNDADSCQTKSPPSGSGNSSGLFLSKDDRWRSLVELSLSAQDACRDLGNTQVFVRNRQKKLEDAVDHLRSLVCPSFEGSQDADDECEGPLAGLQSPLGIVAAVESKLEQFKMEKKCAEELLSRRTGELEALRAASQKMLKDLACLYKARMAEANVDYLAQIRHANERTEIARSQSTGLQTQLGVALEKVRSLETLKKHAIEDLTRKIEDERKNWTEKVETLERRLAESNDACLEVKSALAISEAAKEELSERLHIVEEQLAFSKAETKRELAELYADLDVLEADIVKQEIARYQQADRLADLQKILVHRDSEIKSLTNRVADKTKALEEERELFQKHRMLWESEIEGLKRRLEAATRAREESERELQRMQLDKVEAVLSTDDEDVAANSVSSEDRYSTPVMSSRTESTRGEESLGYSPSEKAEVEKQMERLNEQLREKDREIESLNEILTRRQIDLDLACRLITTMSVEESSKQLSVSNQEVNGKRKSLENDLKWKLADLETEVKAAWRERDDLIVELEDTRSRLHESRLKEVEAEERAKAERKSRENALAQLKDLAKGTMALYSAFEESKQNAALVALGQHLQSFEMESVLATSRMENTEHGYTPLKPLRKSFTPSPGPQVMNGSGIEPDENIDLGIMEAMASNLDR